MPFTIFTDDCTKLYLDYTSKDIVRSDDDLRIFYTTHTSRVAATELLRFACPACHPHEPCVGWENLHRHLLIEHNSFLYKHCAPKKRIFMHEHRVLTWQELRIHLRAEHGGQAHVLQQHHDIFAQPSTDLRPGGIKAARYITFWELFEYPEGIAEPRMPIAHGRGVRIYQPYFLLQFRRVCKLKPSSDWDQKLAELNQEVMLRHFIADERAAAAVIRDKRAKVMARRREEEEAVHETRWTEADEIPTHNGS
ncbi:hypothetical protein B0A55_00152 [Friedmanniomyces simplex]|uniref:Eukaryotic translation initiation factor 4G1 eIF4E-binding domain-containing protein n=1 Tax=Friedmanniomyces simplex TaxID=329884 RepID=A0A4V5NIN2_9PEZI|nr:hypothetical protein B0A55_00152 [Friedmanniomyces simplex]